MTHRPTVKLGKLKPETIVKMSNLLEHGRSEIKTKDKLEEFAIGSLISYLTKSNFYKPGGYIYKFEEESFIYLSIDFKEKKRVRYENVQKMFVGDVYQVNNDLISFKPTTQKPTKFSVEVDGIVLFYGQSDFQKKRFRVCEKFRRLEMWLQIFKNKQIDN